ncbi:unnamed protein product [Hydatigera taeniaeformis]|uniref:Uncharacterized protein n=1 Tax=Hydatigena taeniaeformis TaxID=6205 RepID=A0A3P7F0B3_HYDTA|nr:unnamed protein product [Hydatigera taeniaeformis]
MAFLRLAHIVAPLIVFYISHGLSAGTSGLNGVGYMLGVIIRLLRLCSFPTPIQLFSEVKLIIQRSGLVIYMLFWMLYLFFGGVIPLTLCDHLLIRKEWYKRFGVGFKYLYFLVFKIFDAFWDFLML